MEIGTDVFSTPQLIKFLSSYQKQLCKVIKSTFLVLMFFLRKPSNFFKQLRTPGRYTRIKNSFEQNIHVIWLILPLVRHSTRQDLSLKH